MQKKSKGEVNYAIGGDVCGACSHFIAASKQCELVDGQIDEYFWCVLFRRRYTARKWERAYRSFTE